MLRIANASGYWGDRFSAVREMVTGGPIDVITGDYLAELTMALLHRRRMKDPSGGFVPVFYEQMEEMLGECLARKIRVVSNAGGLNPRALAEKLDLLARRLGVSPKIAYVDGDDLLPRMAELAAAGETFAHADRGTTLADAKRTPVTANAYLGGWAITEALRAGADVVVTGRVTDAALVVGPSAWRFDWKRDDWDRLAGAVCAGHILECGPQATGGNYAFYEEIPRLADLGFPIAEMHEDGSFVVTKHPGTGGAVTVGTVTAQLLYGIGDARYASPDVVARFDTAQLSQEGPDRVRVAGIRGEPPPPHTKVCLNVLGGFRNSMTIVLAGRDIDAKATHVEKQLWDMLGGKEHFSATDARLLRSSREDPQSNEEALATLTVTVMSPDAERVGRAFSSRVVELAIASVPGLTFAGPPKDATPYVVYWPAFVDNRHIRADVHLGDHHFTIPGTYFHSSVPQTAERNYGSTSPSTPSTPSTSPTKRVALGELFGARSGDKGGNANLGVWARDDDGFAFLDAFLTVDRLRTLIPEAAELEIQRARLANLRAINFLLVGYLGEGVASSTRIDPQAKTLGEYLRAKLIDAPAHLVHP